MKPYYEVFYSPITNDLVLFDCNEYAVNWNQFGFIYIGELDG